MTPNTSNISVELRILSQGQHAISWECCFLLFCLAETTMRVSDADFSLENTVDLTKAACIVHWKMWGQSEYIHSGTLLRCNQEFSASHTYTKRLQLETINPNETSRIPKYKNHVFPNLWNQRAELMNIRCMSKIDTFGFDDFLWLLSILSGMEVCLSD